MRNLAQSKPCEATAQTNTRPMAEPNGMPAALGGKNLFPMARQKVCS